MTAKSQRILFLPRIVLVMSETVVRSYRRFNKQGVKINGRVGFSKNPLISVMNEKRHKCLINK